MWRRSVLEGVWARLTHLTAGMKWLRWRDARTTAVPTGNGDVGG